MTLIIKLLLGSTGAGSLAVGGYGVYELVRPKTIGQQLVWEGETFGDVTGSSDDTETTGLWAKLYAKYSSETNQNNKFKGLNPAINSKETLKNHCKKVFDFSVSDSENLKQARFWCIRKSSKLDKQ